MLVFTFVEDIRIFKEFSKKKSYNNYILKMHKKYHKSSPYDSCTIFLSHMIDVKKSKI